MEPPDRQKAAQYGEDHRDGVRQPKGLPLGKQWVQFEALALKGLEAFVRSWRTTLVLMCFTVVGPILFHALHTQVP